MGDETGHKDASFINQETETVFHLPHFLFAVFFNYRTKQYMVAPTMLLNLSFKHAHSVAVT